jgi:hypothetical protein
MQKQYLYLQRRHNNGMHPTRTTFSLPLGEVHSLVGGVVNARPLLFLHGFPDHPPTVVPFLEHLGVRGRANLPNKSGRTLLTVSQ